MNNLSKELLTVAEVAKFTGLSKSTLNKMRIHGNGPTYLKLGTRVVYVHNDVLSWLEGCRINNTSQKVEG